MAISRKQQDMVCTCNIVLVIKSYSWGRRDLVRMVVGFPTTCTISTYHH